MNEGKKDYRATPLISRYFGNYWNDNNLSEDNFPNMPLKKSNIYNKVDISIPHSENKITKKRQLRLQEWV